MVAEKTRGHHILSQGPWILVGDQNAGVMGSHPLRTSRSGCPNDLIQHEHIRT